MIKKIITISVLPIFLFSFEINFSEALDLALQNNKELKAKKLSIEKAKEDLKEAKGYDYGTLKFNENYTKTNHAGYVFGMKMAQRGATFSDFGFDYFIDNMGGLMSSSTTTQANTRSDLLAHEPNELNEPDAYSNYETKLSYDIPLFTGFKLSSAKQMSKLQIKANKAKYNFDEKSLGLEVLKAYNGAVAAKYFIDATKKAKEATSSFVEFANELYKEGLVTAIDVKQAGVYDLGVNARYEESNNQYQQALAYLRFLTGNRQIDKVGEFVNISSNSTELNSLQKEAIDNRDDYNWMDLNTKTMKKKIDFDSAEQYPMIGAHAEYGYNEQSVSMDDDQSYYLMAVGLEYKIFDGMKISTAKQKAKIEYKKTNYYFEYMKDGIKLQVENNLLNLQTKQKILKEKIKAGDLADEVLLQSKEMYKNNLINMSNLLMQQANAQRARAEVIKSKYDVTIAAAQLKLSLGKSLKEN